MKNLRTIFERILLLIFVSIGFFSLSTSISAQGRNVHYRAKAFNDTLIKVCNPIDSPVTFAGNYGEFRDGRYHAGLDYRVGARVGDTIKSIMDGYVSRIFISPELYGNAVEVTHIDSTISIYSHLYDFAPKLDEVLKAEQYRLECDEVDVDLEPAQIPLKAGQFLGRVGNSGLSQAPHLHFEMRNYDQSIALNPIRHGYVSREDRVKPVIRQVNFYSIYDTLGVPLTKLSHSFKQVGDSIVPLSRHTYLAIDAVDKQSNQRANLAIEQFIVTIDRDTIYHYNLGDFAYQQQGSFNSLIEYSAKILEKRSMLKTYIEPGNAISDKIKFVNRGVVELNDFDVHNLRVEVKDFDGNTTSQNYKVQRTHLEDIAMKEHINQELMGDYYMAPWFLYFTYTTPEFSLLMPSGSLYSSALLSIKKEGDFWSVHSSTVPLAQDIQIQLKPLGDIYYSKADKVLLVTRKSKGDLQSFKGVWKDSTYVVDVNVFGDFRLVVDTLSPSIKPMFSTSKPIYLGRLPEFRISDNYTEKLSYRVEVDGKWQRCEYDIKNKKLILLLEDEYYKKESRHTVLVKVWDDVGNVSEKSFIVNLALEPPKPSKPPKPSRPIQTLDSLPSLGDKVDQKKEIKLNSSDTLVKSLVDEAIIKKDTTTVFENSTVL